MLSYLIIDLWTRYCKPNNLINRLLSIWWNFRLIQRFLWIAYTRFRFINHKWCVQRNQVANSNEDHNLCANQTLQTTTKPIRYLSYQIVDWNRNANLYPTHNRPFTGTTPKYAHAFVERRNLYLPFCSQKKEVTLTVLFLNCTIHRCLSQDQTGCCSKSVYFRRLCGKSTLRVHPSCILFLAATKLRETCSSSLKVKGKKKQHVSHFCCCCWEFECNLSSFFLSNKRIAFCIYNVHLKWIVLCVSMCIKPYMIHHVRCNERPLLKVHKLLITNNFKHLFLLLLN